jgi:hypothetical protein
MFQKSSFYFLPKFYWRFLFGGGKFSSTLKPNSERSLGPRPTFPFPDGVMGNIFWENSSGSPDFAPKDGPPVHKV